MDETAINRSRIREILVAGLKNRRRDHRLSAGSVCSFRSSRRTKRAVKHPRNYSLSFGRVGARRRRRGRGRGGGKKYSPSPASQSIFLVGWNNTRGAANMLFRNWAAIRANMERRGAGIAERAERGGIRWRNGD